MNDINQLAQLAYDLRKCIVDIVMAGQCGHIGGDMSVIDILTALYFNELNISPETRADPNRDRFMLSKGHCIEAYYAVLAARGFISKTDVLNQFNKFGSPYIGHPNNKLPGIEMNSGSLGHGLPVSIGMALAARMDGRTYRVYTVMGDGELAEGSVWEGAMAASHYKLDNLCAIIDRNRLQISGSTESVMAQSSQESRWTAFGWHVLSINGNDMGELCAAFSTARTIKGKPTMIIANTTKGCGSAVMENKAQWHHKVPTKAEYIQIMHDLEARKETLR